MEPHATPARLLDVPVEEGCRVLEHADVGHLDGGEALVADILRDAKDLSALSDELAAHDEVWPTRYHLARERGHIVRALELAPDARVLEIGAGCGAVTRYLGERCAVVDALEPTPARAHIAHLRTRDLPSVEVFIGSLDAIPREPAYDAVVMVGVLEYVGGPEAWDERVAFLREAAARLREGGTVVCAIENRFGAQYVAGAPEEHLGASFAGLEGYPAGGHVRTFSRSELQQLFAEAGLTASVHGVLPDYKFARLVFGDALLESEARPLAWSVPQLPSRSSPHARPKLTSELHLWRGLVEAGLGADAPNSFLVLGTAGGEPSPLWPRDLHAVFFSAGRRAAYAIETRLRGSEGALRLERVRLRPDVEPPAGPLVQRPQDAEWVSGVPLLDLLEQGDLDALGTWLRRWRALAEERLGDAADVNVDLVPHNVVVDGDALAVIDHEWYDDDATAQDVVARGLLATALTLAERCPPSRWTGCETIADVAHLLFRLAEVDADFEEHVVKEADRQAQMAGIAPSDQLQTLRATLAQPLRDMPLGDREADFRAQADAATASAQEAYGNAMARVAELDGEIVLREQMLSEQGQQRDAAERALREELEHARAEAGRLSAELQELTRRYQDVVGSRRWAVARRIPALPGRGRR